MILTSEQIEIIVRVARDLDNEAIQWANGQLGHLGPDELSASEARREAAVLRSILPQEPKNG